MQRIEKIVNFEHNGIEVTGNYFRANSFEYCLTLKERDEQNYRRNNCSFFVAVPNPIDVNNHLCIDSDVRSLNEYLRLSTLAYDDVFNKVKTRIIDGYNQRKVETKKSNDLTRSGFSFVTTIPNPLEFKLISVAEFVDYEYINPENSFFDEMVEERVMYYKGMFIDAEMQVIEIHEDMKRLHIELMESNYKKLKE